MNIRAYLLEFSVNLISIATMFTLDITTLFTLDTIFNSTSMFTSFDCNIVLFLMEGRIHILKQLLGKHKHLLKDSELLEVARWVKV